MSERPSLDLYLHLCHYCKQAFFSKTQYILHKENKHRDLMEPLIQQIESGCQSTVDYKDSQPKVQVKFEEKFENGSNEEITNYETKESDSNFAIDKLREVYSVVTPPAPPPSFVTLLNEPETDSSFETILGSYETEEGYFEGPLINEAGTSNGLGLHHQVDQKLYTHEEQGPSSSNLVKVEQTNKQQIESGCQSTVDYEETQLKAQVNFEEKFQNGSNDEIRNFETKETDSNFATDKRSGFDPVLTPPASSSSFFATSNKEPEPDSSFEAILGSYETEEGYFESPWINKGGTSKGLELHHQVEKFYTHEEEALACSSLTKVKENDTPTKSIATSTVSSEKQGLCLHAQTKVGEKTEGQVVYESMTFGQEAETAEDGTNEKVRMDTDRKFEELDRSINLNLGSRTRFEGHGELLNSQAVGNIAVEPKPNFWRPFQSIESPARLLQSTYNVADDNGQYQTHHEPHFKLTKRVGFSYFNYPHVYQAKYKYYMPLGTRNLTSTFNSAQVNSQSTDLLEMVNNWKGKKYQSAFVLPSHIELKSTTAGQALYHCPVCSTTFKTKYRAKYHAFCLYPEKQPALCTDCIKVARRNDGWRIEHLLRTRKDQIAKNCSNCGGVVNRHELLMDWTSRVTTQQRQRMLNVVENCKRNVASYYADHAPCPTEQETDGAKPSKADNGSLGTIDAESGNFSPLVIPQTPPLIDLTCDVFEVEESKVLDDVVQSK